MIFAILLLYHAVELFDGGGRPGPVQWGGTLLGILAGSVLFAVVVAGWPRRWPLVWVVFALTALWLGYSLAHLPSHVFLDFAALFIPWAVRGDVRRTASLLVSILGIAAVHVYVTTPVRDIALLDAFLVSGVLLLSALTAGQVLLVRMVLNLERLAQLAERERIAYDLRGVLGQALAEITTRSTRVRAVLGRDTADLEQTAGMEITAVEELARGALADVRRTLREYRKTDTIPGALP